ncbi:MAG: hypothetical protein HYX74_01245 [Acidobacteria bacterium]|nr:hypothetical protein [Acidobacteriota bacterium]
MRNAAFFLTLSLMLTSACSRGGGGQSAGEEGRPPQLQPDASAPQAASEPYDNLLPPPGETRAFEATRPAPRPATRTRARGSSRPAVTTAGSPAPGALSPGRAAGESPAAAPDDRQGERPPLRRTPRQEEVWNNEPQPAPLAPSAPTASQERVVIPAGTEFTVRILDRISSEEARTGETFAAIVDRDIRNGGRVVIPTGSDVSGRLASVRRSGRVSGRAELAMELESVAIDGQTYDLRTNQVTLRAESAVKEDTAKIAGGAAIGAIVGAVAGGKKGAAVGATIGAGSGSATVLATRGKAAVVDRETPLRFRLQEPVEVVIFAR